MIRIFLTCIAVLTFTFAFAACQSSAKDEGKPEAKKAETVKWKLPGISYNKEEGYIDLAGEVVLNDGLLELIATSGNKKTHESIINITATPSHVHLATTLLGGKHGNPGTYKSSKAKSFLRRQQAAKCISA